MVTAIVVGVVVVLVAVGSVYALYRSVIAREDGYYGDFDGPEDFEDDYLTDSEWEEIEAERNKHEF